MYTHTKRIAKRFGEGHAHDHDQCERFTLPHVRRGRACPWESRVGARPVRQKLGEDYD